MNPGTDPAVINPTLPRKPDAAKAAPLDAELAAAREIVDPMNKFRTEICVKPSDVEMILSWHDEREYWLGRAFLAKIDDYPESLRQTDPNHLEWYYLDEAQYQALLDFRKRLRERRAGRSDGDGNSR